MFRPYVGWTKYFAQSGLVQPWDPKLIPNLKHLNPKMVKAGQYNGKQYGIPEDWGFDAVLYRSDKVNPKAKSWSLLFDERYKGRIAWFDDAAHARIAGPATTVQEALAPDRRPAREGAEVPHLQEAPGPDVLGVRDGPGKPSPRATSGSPTPAQRLGADEGKKG